MSDATKANLAVFMADQARIELFFDTLANLDRAINTDREIASSNRAPLPSDAVDGALARSPEETAAASTAPADVAPQFATMPPPPVLPLQSARCPLRVPLAVAPMVDDAMVGPIGQAKRAAEEARNEDQDASVDRWLAVSRRGKPEGQNKKAQEGVTPTQMDEDTADADEANKK